MIEVGRSICQVKCELNAVVSRIKEWKKLNDYHDNSNWENYNYNCLRRDTLVFDQ